MLFWGVLAYLIASHTNDIIVWALTQAYGSPTDAPPNVLSKLTYFSPVFPFALGLLAILRLKLGGEKLSELIGYSNGKIVSDILIGAIVAVALVAVSVFSMRIAGRYAPLPPFDLMPSSMHFYFATIGAVIPGIFEEIYFRGMMLRIGKQSPAILALLISAAAFSLWHIGTPAYLPHTFVLGLTLGAVFLRTGRLMPAIIAHTFANASIGILLLNGFKIAASG